MQTKMEIYQAVGLWYFSESARNRPLLGGVLKIPPAPHAHEVKRSLWSLPNRATKLMIRGLRSLMRISLASHNHLLLPSFPGDAEFSLTLLSRLTKFQAPETLPGEAEISKEDSMNQQNI